MKRVIFLIMAVAVIIFQNGLSAAAQEDLFDTKAAGALYEQGMNNLRGSKLEEAIAAFEESLSIAPDARTYYFLGYAYYLKGKTGDIDSRKKSLESFEQAYELDPNFTPAKYEHTENMDPIKPEQQSPEPEQNPIPESNVPDHPAPAPSQQ